MVTSRTYILQAPLGRALGFFKLLSFVGQLDIKRFFFCIIIGHKDVILSRIGDIIGTSCSIAVATISAIHNFRVIL